MADPVRIQLTARPTQEPLPSWLLSTARSADGAPADSSFLPSGYLALKQSLDVGAASRGSAAGASAQTLAVDDPDEVLLVELADRSTLVTTAAALKESLQRARPDLIGPSGEILFEQLRIEGGSSRGVFDGVVGGIVGKVFRLVAGQASDAIIDDAKRELGGRAAEIGVTWAGTKALMWAVEKRLFGQPGTLTRWTDGPGDAALQPVTPAQLAAGHGGPQGKPMLVFLHGTASHTRGSFGALQGGERDAWQALQRAFPDAIYAFEHRTLSESPIDNALALLAQLPAGARVSLVSHSRGGLVGDLLCLAGLDAQLIDRYRAELPGIGSGDAEETARVRGELDDAHAAQRARLVELAAALSAKQIVVERYVRVASPAQGTRLASGNFDVFLSGLLTLIGQVPFLFGQPIYEAFKRVVLEIVKRRTDPHLVPGIEAMLPDAPLGRLLREAPAQPGLRMAVIAGDVEGGGMLQRLGVLLTDFLLFDSVDNDLVVDTESMFAGIAPQAGAHALFDRGSDVTHFRYFGNLDTRFALRDWLTDAPARLESFQPLAALRGPDDFAAATTRGDAAALPVAVLLPGVMGSHLRIGGKDRIWLDPVDIVAGGLAKIAWGRPGVEAEELFAMSYGALAKHLSATHRVERYPYDWRQPLDELGQRFGDYLEGLLKTTTQPIRLVAHSMGGLVVRAAIVQRRAVMDALMQRDGARLVMLGTPHQGAHSMVENLLGKGDTLRTLVRLDLKHDMREVLEIVAGFRGPLQLLPKPGFVDDFQGDPEGGKFYDYAQPRTWVDFREQVQDFWFGDKNSATPDAAALDAASWLWRQDGQATPALPEAYAANSIYVFGVAPNTPCGVRPDAKGRLKMVGTPRGDGTVTWRSGRIGGIGRYYYLPAAHGSLCDSEEHFPALAELLAAGSTARLATAPPALRALEALQPLQYDAGPPALEDAATLTRALAGGRPPARPASRPKRRLAVRVRAMDLRFLDIPVLVGHYQDDPIAGPQKLIDRELLDGDLTQRHALGLYAGPRGSAAVVLRAPNAQERRRGSLSGAVVAGLGDYERPMSLRDLTDAVRAGALRYLLQVTDVLGKDERELPLATLLVGYNSSANLSVANSVEALVSGVLEANARFFETTRVPIRIGRLDIVEIYLDTAITAAYELRRLAPKLAEHARDQRSALDCAGELASGDGARPRLFDRGSTSYWPRLIVTDAGPAAPDAAGAAPVAARLRFLYVGQRARAESLVQQRQPGLLEALVRRQIATKAWNDDIGRMLFQLMVPPDFKDAARQLDRVVLVVDAATANFPWELMAADQLGVGGATTPLAVRVPVVRQLETREFRRVVRQSMQRSALVIGHPGVEGFAAAFAQKADPDPLPGAEAEAEAVADVLRRNDYAVTPLIGSDTRAEDVFAALYRQPWRFVHISAHGVFDLPHRDGGRRSGVVLSDGLLITAAEIEAMEAVPELVFLNCCHLAKIDATVRDGNKLAASIARELIGIGVRCVIVAGWAVDDQGAQRFGEAFYRALLLDGMPFGDAVYAARYAVWKATPSDITWGAFQAYGDAGWTAEPVRGSRSGAPLLFVTPDELLDELAALRASVSRRSARLTASENAAQARAVKALCERMAPGWRELPALQSALGRTWAELGRLDDARKAYAAAVMAEDRRGVVPIRDLEQLANIEARLGEGAGDPQLIEAAIARLERLDTLIGTNADDAPTHAERCALRGSAWKRLASVHAAVLLGERPALAGVDHGQATRAALDAAARAYRRGEAGAGGIDPYLALNRLALDALTLDRADQAGIDERVALADRCGALADAAFALRGADVYTAVMPAEAQLVRSLLDGSWLGGDGDAARDAVITAYRESLANITITPKELDSVAKQPCLLARFFDALAVSAAPGSTPTATVLHGAASRLIALADGVAPNACNIRTLPSIPPPPPRPARPPPPRPRPLPTRKTAAKKGARR